MRILIATIKSWNISNSIKFKDKNLNHDVKIITTKEELSIEQVSEFKPDVILFPHWSWIIPKEIYENYECIVFHMTDLPFGRGGSPLQNLISRNIKTTKISALRVDGGIDTGKIYMKENLELYGNADEIFVRASSIIFDKMIPNIIDIKPNPIEQVGIVESFSRRSEKESKLEIEFELEKIYNYIRMLDGEDYPKAYIQFGKYKIEFSKAFLKHKKIEASVEIIEGDE